MPVTQEVSICSKESLPFFAKMSRIRNWQSLELRKLGISLLIESLELKSKYDDSTVE